MLMNVDEYKFDVEDRNPEEIEVVFKADREIYEEVEGMINMEGSTKRCVWRLVCSAFLKQVFQPTRHCSDQIRV